MHTDRVPGAVQGPGPEQIQQQHHEPLRHLPVFRARDFRVVHGVNEGDPLADAAELVHEDIYALTDDARPSRLALAIDAAAAPAGATNTAAPGFRIGADSEAGRPGAAVYLDSLLTFMCGAGAARDALVFVEVDARGAIAEIYLYPLAPLAPKTGYTLVTIDRSGARARLAETATIAFTRGTRITLAGGAQVPIEVLKPGTRVLTRDSGAQALRWIGVQTLRATGACAPITIRAGVLHNTGDLVVSPGHRLFVYQRIDALKAGRKEVLVRAGLLVNGSSVTQDPGGFVDYFQLLFDKHEIIYAEGIAAESLPLDTTTRAALPDEIAHRLGAGPGLPLSARELKAGDLAARKNPAELLRRVSTF